MKSKWLQISQMLLILGLAFGLASYSGSLKSGSLNSGSLNKSSSSEPGDYRGVRARYSFKQSKRGVLDVSRPNLAYPGVTLVAASGSEQVQLVDLQGNIVHRWYVDVQRARLLPSGNLLAIHGSKWGIKQRRWQKQRKFVREYDWDGNVVWEHYVKSKAHHDVQRLPNGNTVFLRFSGVPRDQRGDVKDPVRRVGRIMSDIIREVSPEGDVVWEWKFHEHFDLNRCGIAACLPYKMRAHDVMQKVKFDWTHMNTVAPIGENRWYNSGDERFRPGNYVILARNWSTVFIIDRKTGEPVWEFSGWPGNRLQAGHEAHMIAEGLPGAGNILIFGNGNKPGQKKQVGSSRVIELDPVRKEVVWEYKPGREFFSNAAGAAQRLPNGNTLISEDVPGRIFEVTADKEVVWQYRAGARTSRAKRYSYNHCPQLRFFQ